jgi:hypothetical protein
MPKKRDRIEASPESLAEFNDYLRFLKEEGESVPSDLKQLQNGYLNFIYFSEVLRNSGLAEQTRWMAICRVAERMGCDPKNEQDRMLMLGIVAYKELAPVPKFVKREGRPKGASKRTKEYLDELEHAVSAVWPSDRRRNWELIAKRLRGNPRYKDQKLSPATIARNLRRRRAYQK